VDGQTRIVERKNRLDGTTEEFVCERLLLEPGKRAVLRYTWRKARRIAGTDLVVPQGGFTISHYWTDRTYNVYDFRSAPPDTRPLGYYCNVVAATTIAEDLVSYDDLVVDVLIDPSGSALVLDEEDLPADLAPAYRSVINKALEELTGNSRRLAAEIERESRRFL
jgi:predicted RNA-binding protein associated with RNAse of E/G family